MTLKELNDRISSQLRLDHTARDREVAIVLVNCGQIGGVRTVPVAYAQCGIDWDNDKYLIYPSDPLDKAEK